MFYKASEESIQGENQKLSNFMDENWDLTTGFRNVEDKSDFDKIAFSAQKWQHTDWQGIEDLMGPEKFYELCFKGEKGMVVVGIWDTGKILFLTIRVGIVSNFFKV